MSYANCPRCWLTVRLAPGAPAPDACPRCFALHAITLPMYRSSAPSASTAAPPHTTPAASRRFAPAPDRRAASLP